jgi:hypothetical protein
LEVAVATAFPYLLSTGLISKILDKITEARRPDRFTQDFLETKLGFSGGSAMPMIPLLKRIGFLASDGTPTPIYDRFRNPDTRGEAMAEGMRTGFKELYDANEYAHDLTKEKLSALITQLTGAEKDSRATRATVATFQNLKPFADFDKQSAEKVVAVVEDPPPKPAPPAPQAIQPPSNVDLKLSYTINLNLPETTNPDVFNVIFKSLKEHLLSEK